jgi:hypothetical protein
MRQRGLLLCGQRQAALTGARQSRLPVQVADAMLLTPSQPIRGTVQSLFCVDHLPGGEAALVAGILAEFDQIWRRADRCHDLIELLHPVAVPMGEPCDVAAGKGRLLMGDGVECD